MSGGAALHPDCRHHDRIEAVRDLELDPARGQRRLLRQRGALRRALVARELHADLLQADHVLRVFNAGVRALDIRDPFSPKEIAYYIPAITDKPDRRCVGRGADERCKVAIQTNNVEVDDRGYIFIVDRANTGMHILEPTGAARRAADFPVPEPEKR